MNLVRKGTPGKRRRVIGMELCCICFLRSLLNHFTPTTDDPVSSDTSSDEDQRRILDSSQSGRAANGRSVSSAAPSSPALSAAVAFNGASGSRQRREGA